jgi:branched-chain amino acid transport system permease protein
MSSLTYKRLLWLVVGAAFLVAPFVAYPLFIIKMLCAALLAASVNFLVGYAGLLSFGHAMFFGSAGYIAGYALKTWTGEGLIGVLAGVTVSAFIGLVTGMLAIRRQGVYFSMITLAFAQVVYFLALRLPFTGGEDGLQNVARPVFLGFIDTTDNKTLYFVTLALIGFGFWCIWRIVYSPFGQVLTAIRDNEARAISLGYQVNRYKLIAFTLSAAIAGLAGSVKVISFGLATLTDVGWGTSGDALLMCIVGGMQTLWGPLVGAILIVALEHLMVSSPEMVQIVQGVVFVAVVMLFRKGIVGQWLVWWKGRQVNTDTAK